MMLKCGECSARPCQSTRCSVVVRGKSKIYKCSLDEADRLEVVKHLQIKEPVLDKKLPSKEVFLERHTCGWKGRIPGPIQEVVRLLGK